MCTPIHSQLHSRPNIPLPRSPPSISWFTYYTDPYSDNFGVFVVRPQYLWVRAQYLWIRSQYLWVRSLSISGFDPPSISGFDHSISGFDPPSISGFDHYITGFDPSTSGLDTVESEGQQIKQCWIKYIKRNKKTSFLIKASILCLNLDVWPAAASAGPEMRSMMSLASSCIRYLLLKGTCL